MNFVHWFFEQGCHFKPYFMPKIPLSHDIPCETATFFKLPLSLFMGNQVAVRTAQEEEKKYWVEPACSQSFCFVSLFYSVRYSIPCYFARYSLSITLCDYPILRLTSFRASKPYPDHPYNFLTTMQTPFQSSF